MIKNDLSDKIYHLLFFIEAKHGKKGKENIFPLTKDRLDPFETIASREVKKWKAPNLLCAFFCSLSIFLKSRT